MTLIIGIKCKDGVVLGADGAATVTDSQLQPTIQMAVKKKRREPPKPRAEEWHLDDDVVPAKGKPPAKEPAPVQPLAPAIGEATADWSHAELIDRLRQRGVRVMVANTSMGSAHGPAMYFFKTGSEVTKKYELDGTPLCAPQWWAGAAYVRKCKSARSAKDVAGVNRDLWNRQRLRGDMSAGGVLNALGGKAGQRMPTTDVTGESAFAWNSFLFVGCPLYLAEIRKALP